MTYCPSDLTVYIYISVQLELEEKYDFKIDVFIHNKNLHTALHTFI